MSQNKTYIHYPADRLIEGKLWPHKIQNMPQPMGNSEFDNIQANKRNLENRIFSALANSIPFDKEFVDEIRGLLTEKDWPFDWHPDSKKIYEIEGIEAKVKIDCSHESCIGECAKCTHLQKFVIIKQAKEEPQESQNEILSSFFKKMVELHNDPNKIEKLKSEFHIQRK